MTQRSGIRVFRRWRCLGWAAVVAMAVAARAPALLAQSPAPKFQFAETKADEAKEAEWKAQAKGGLLITGGNSRSTSGSLGAGAGYRRGGNRVTLDGALTYVSSSVLSVLDTNTDGRIQPDELTRTETVTSNAWEAKARYDRFLTTNNSVYVSGQAMRDRPAGKAIVAGGQVGYSRQILKTDRQLLVAELGYDFSYQEAVGPTAAGVSVHSARAFVAETLTLTEATGATASLEALTNLNEETAPAPGFASVDPLQDTRLTGKLGLTTRLWKNVGFGFGFTARYDNAPAPLPAIKTPAGTLPFDYPALAKKLDTLVEATLIVTFL